MGGGTTSSSSENRPLTAAERQDIYQSSVGNILGTYQQSGLPVAGVGSQNPTPAMFNPNGAIPMQNNNGVWSSGLNPSGVTTPAASKPGTLYNSTGSAYQNPNTSGFKSLNPFGLADTPNVSMPTGGPNAGGINFPLYQTPTYQSPGNFQTFDTNSPAYANILKGYTDPLDAQKSIDIERYNDSAANRGIWSSGLAEQGVNDINRAYAPQYTAAGGAATSAQLGQLAGENTYDQAAANAANTFNQGNAQNQFSSGWAPLNYLSSLYAGTAGNIGGTNTFGANISI